MLKNKFLGKLFSGALACTLLLSPVSVFATGQTAPEGEAIITAYDKQIDSNQWDSWPTGPAIHAESAIVMEANTGTVLYAKGMEEKNYPASITKILTALVVLEHCSLDEEVTFSYHATHSIEYGSSSIARTEGEILTVEEALYGLMLASANECANALAEHVSGSSEQFAVLMNEKAKELGCVNSHFSNPSGLHDENHYTCAYDMALITQAAIQNEAFRRISGTDYYTLRATNKNDEELFMQNHHNMIAPYRTAAFLDETIFSGKTGYTTDALNTLVTCGTRNGMDVIVVTMRTPSTAEKGVPLFTDTAALLDYANNFRKINISENEKTFMVGNAYDFSVESNDLKTSGSLISINKDSYVILPGTASFTDAVPSITFEESSQGNEAFLSYQFSEQFIGKASITLEKQSESDFQFSETESGSATEEGTKFFAINFKIILIILLIIAGLIILILMLRSLYTKNRAKIRKAINIRRKRRFLTRRRYRRRKRR